MPGSDGSCRRRTYLARLAGFGGSALGLGGCLRSESDAETTTRDVEGDAETTAATPTATPAASTTSPPSTTVTATTTAEPYHPIRSQVGDSTWSELNARFTGEVYPRTVPAEDSTLARSVREEVDLATWREKWEREEYTDVQEYLGNLAIAVTGRLSDYADSVDEYPAGDLTAIYGAYKYAVHDVGITPGSVIVDHRPGLQRPTASYPEPMVSILVSTGDGVSKMLIDLEPNGINWRYIRQAGDSYHAMARRSYLANLYRDSLSIPAEVREDLSRNVRYPRSFSPLDFSARDYIEENHEFPHGDEGRNIFRHLSTYNDDDLIVGDHGDLEPVPADPTEPGRNDVRFTARAKRYVDEVCDFDTINEKPATIGRRARKLVVATSVFFYENVLDADAWDMQIDHFANRRSWAERVGELEAGTRAFLATREGLICKQVEARNYTF